MMRQLPQGGLPRWQLRCARIKKVGPLAVCPMQEERLCRNFHSVCVAGLAHRGHASPLQTPAAVSLGMTESDVKQFLPRIVLYKLVRILGITRNCELSWIWPRCTSHLPQGLFDDIL